jgi:demethylspheroidene O-methyltransferase
VSELGTPAESKAAATSTPRAAQSWSDWWFTLRNRMLMSTGFQRWAERLPVAKLIAAHRTSALFELCAGFVYSQVLFAGVRLKLFEALAEGPQSVEVLARRVGLAPDAALRLLDAAASLKLAEARPHGRYGLGIHGVSLVSNPAVASLVEHHALFYRDLVDPVALLAGTQPSTELSRFWSYAGTGPGALATPAAVAPYSELMAASMTLLADDLLDAYPLAGHRHLMDLAGGEGAFVQAASRISGLELTLFDLPPVAERARARLAGVGLERVKVVGGDLFATPLPRGADVMSLVRVVHDHDDEQALRILSAARAALPQGGVLLLAEPMAGTPGAEKMGAAYFGFYLLAMGQGRARSPEALGALVQAAGFSSHRLATTRRPMLTRLLVAKV